MQPAIKWSGFKRSQTKEILKYFPKNIETYYEPFIGGGSILSGVLDSDIHCNNYVCSDLNSDLIGLWIMIRDNPEKCADEYERRWTVLNSYSTTEDRWNYFREIRDSLNKYHNPEDFMFIMRTCTNGMPRYNSEGEFNNSFHYSRPGINPRTLRNIILQWSSKIQSVEFKSVSYKLIIPSNENDFVYLDPPYANTKGMYFDSFDNTKLWDYLRNCKCKYALSYDGISGKSDNTYAVPGDVYSEHVYIKSGNSSFKRYLGKDRVCEVYESLYIR